MTNSKYYPYRGEVDEEMITVLEKEGADSSQLFVNRLGALYIKVERDESEYHPDDKMAARVFYQSTGLSV